jgi:hypothetical protein
MTQWFLLSNDIRPNLLCRIGIVGPSDAFEGGGISMPLFYFHTTGADPHHDEDGQEFATRSLACDQALISAGELLKDSRTQDGRFDLELEVMDAGHKPIFRLNVTGRVVLQ